MPLSTGPIPVRLADLEPVKEFFAGAVAASELLSSLTPEQTDELPAAARSAADKLRRAVRDGRAAGIIGDPDDNENEVT